MCRSCFYLCVWVFFAAACADSSGNGGLDDDAGMEPDTSAEVDGEAETDADTVSDTKESTDSNGDTDSQEVVDTDAPSNIGSPLAINLASVNYYSRQWTFLDQTKHGASFNYAANPVELDADGWVLTGDAGLFLNTGLDGHYPGGQYIVTYEGEADFYTLESIWDADGTPMSNDAALNTTASTPGRLILDITPSNNGFVLSYRNINFSNPVKQLEIVHEDYQDTFETGIFHPRFLDSIRPFSTLRFMDMMKTNNSTQQSWEERPLITDAFQGTDKGVALEYMIALANRAGANPWFTIPHMADDVYVRNFATLVREKLDSALDVYLEYSNEVWNGGFSQYEYARAQGVAAGLGAERDAADHYYIRRSVEIFKIFEAVFGETGRKGLKRVIASQNSPYWALRMMEWKDPKTDRLGIEDADYWAVAPYFCGNPPSEPGSVDELLDACEADIADTLASAKEIGDAARSHGAALISYEGGQHIRNDTADEEAQTIYNLANDDPRMGWLYKKYLDQWRADQGQMFTLFSLISGQSVYGRWGILKAQDDLSYPKYAAVIDWISKNEVWW